MKLKGLVERIWALHRTLVSDGTDEALRLIGESMPEASGYGVETYSPGGPVWTWKAPERYVVHEAYLEIEGGDRIVDFNDNPLHLVSYSPPVDLSLTWEELVPHLHHSPERPGAIPWVFKYYDRDWGFCLPKERFDALPRDAVYRAVIRSEFLDGPKDGLAVGIGTVHPEGGPAEENPLLLICAHVCHPRQANDDAAGVAVAVEVARRLAVRRLPAGSMGVRFLFCPETIGSICYLSHHEDLIPRFQGGIFCEMLGNRNSLVLQRTRQDEHLLDRAARDRLKRRKKPFREGAFREVIVNDELVINGPGVDIPCISISRWPYPEYHTSDDSPDIIHEDMLEEGADVIEDIVRVYASDYRPRRTFRGPVFLSGHGLWVDWREDPEMNAIIDKMMMRFEGIETIFEIGEALGVDYWEAREIVERFRTRDLVEALPVSGGRRQPGQVAPIPGP